MTIGEKIKKFRLEKGLTIKQLAEKANLSVTTVWGYENDKHKPSVITSHKLAKILDCSAYELYNLK